ncbi:hypothetical protein GCM10007424_14340 [Flavobacterium suaedae]|uniref:PspC domain-containing protein n=1 Tax=Flavobacterium suaedae TaxID=1767027 RepID=A0ABQ1JR83_9FLAO|nr:PspC domain-containing protein [Flavobacterium suaedae]GGB75535.1 hypothetical protein GCM10007424_14340 [Flavobacterium suaedae]
MNKTVSINLGGLFFHIDENAYLKLNKYFDAIRLSLAPDGRDEIMSDIESRIAELLSEKLDNNKQVVTSIEVEQIIEIMGEPEDYMIDDDEPKQKSSTQYSHIYRAPKTRKFYRDGDSAIIAGVCAGIAHYFRIDPLWIRILFIVSPFITFGTSVIIYVLLWLLIPKAITTAEKLEMTGEPINISNIERKVREEFETLGNKIQSVDYNKLGKDAKTSAQKVGNGFGKVFVAIFKGFAKVIGALIVIAAAFSLVGTLVAFITALFSSSFESFPWNPYANALNYINFPFWLLATFMFLVVAIPVFGLFILGLKILTENMKSIGNFAKYSLLAIWLVALSGIIYVGVAEHNEISSEGKTMMKEEINIAATDTLNLKFRYNSFFSKSFKRNVELRITQDTSGNNLIYSNRVRLYVMRTEGTTPYLQVEKISWGKNMDEARERSKYIDYNFDLEGNTLILDNYLTTAKEHKYRNQKVELYLYLPEGMYFYPDSSVKYYDNTSNYFFDLWFDSDNVYRMGRNHVECLTCESEEDEEYIDESGEEAIIQQDTTKKEINIKSGDLDIELKSGSNKLHIKNN